MRVIITKTKLSDLLGSEKFDNEKHLIGNVISSDKYNEN